MKKDESLLFCQLQKRSSQMNGHLPRRIAVNTRFLFCWPLVSKQAERKSDIQRTVKLCDLWMPHVVSKKSLSE